MKQKSSDPKRRSLARYKRSAKFGIGRSRKGLKRDKAAAERAVKRRIRANVAARDTACRVGGGGPDCDGRLEWAHLPEQSRAKTRGMAPERRHTTQMTVMACTRHHRDLDARRFTYEFLDAGLGADGLMRFGTMRFIPA